MTLKVWLTGPVVWTDIVGYVCLHHLTHSNEIQHGSQSVEEVCVFIGSTLPSQPKGRGTSTQKFSGLLTRAYTVCRASICVNKLGEG